MGQSLIRTCILAVAAFGVALARYPGANRGMLRFLEDKLMKLTVSAMMLRFLSFAQGWRGMSEEERIEAYKSNGYQWPPTHATYGWPPKEVYRS